MKFKPLGPTARKHLSFDAMAATIRAAFDELSPPKPANGKMTLADALMAGFAMFSLKDASLLEFDERRKANPNLLSIYKIQHAPCDTRMREMLDPVDPEALRPVFRELVRQLQRGKVLKQLEFLPGKLLVALDGTEHFCSGTIHCPKCLVRTDRSGATRYYHQAVGAALVHPKSAAVIPLAPEPILRQDGQSKNDCERNATRRRLAKLRQDFPRQGFIILEDALASNAPHIEDLRKHQMDFILAVKPGDHEHLYGQVLAAYEAGQVTELSRRNPDEPGGRQLLAFVNDLPLNESHPHVRVAWMTFEQYGPDGQRQRRFDWVLSLTVTRRIAWELVPGARARWKIENETFNTLKNQGYHYEHNYGHGKENLASVLAALMMLAFLVDQIQQLCCRTFQAVRQKLGSRRRVWEEQRTHFRHFVFASMRALHLAILYDLCNAVTPPAPAGWDTS